APGVRARCRGRRAARGERGRRASRAPRGGRPAAPSCSGDPCLLLRAAREGGVALLDERAARLLGVGRGVELEREALLEAVALLGVEELDPVQRPLGEAQPPL